MSSLKRNIIANKITLCKVEKLLKVQVYPGNDVTMKDAYPLPRIDESLDQLSGSKWFSCLDLSAGYWQVEVDPEDKQKTAFLTRRGLFEYNVMPFGLCNAPATFERLMKTVLYMLDIFG